MFAAMAIESVVQFYLLLFGLLALVSAGLMLYVARKLDAKETLFSFLKLKLSDFRGKETRLQALLILGAFFSLFIFANALFWPMTSSPASCVVGCHSMNREYVTWQKSAHSKITCTACHAKPGLMPFIHEKTIEGPLALVAELIGHETPINAESHLGKDAIPKETCERCHDMTNRKVSPSRIFSDKMYGSGKDKFHNKHIKKGIPCTLCHNRVTHKNVNEPDVIKQAEYSMTNKYDKKIIGKEYEDGMSMTGGCFRCHSPAKEERDHELVKKYKAAKAPKTCKTCHPKDLLPVDHYNIKWRAEHTIIAKEDFNYCFNCHAEYARFNFKGKKYCTRCHDKSLIETWK